MEAIVKKTNFLADKLLKNDLVLVEIIEPAGPQSLTARVEKIYSCARTNSKIDLGSDIEFVYAPANWGREALAKGDRALLFVSNTSGRLYEDIWNGHFVIENIAGEVYAIYQLKQLWLDKGIPEKIRGASIQDPKRSYATAINFKQLEQYIQKLIKNSG